MQDAVFECLKAAASISDTHRLFDFGVVAFSNSVAVRILYCDACRLDALGGAPKPAAGMTFCLLNPWIQLIRTAGSQDYLKLADSMKLRQNIRMLVQIDCRIPALAARTLIQEPAQVAA